MLVREDPLALIPNGGALDGEPAHEIAGDVPADVLAVRAALVAHVQVVHGIDGSRPVMEGPSAFVTDDDVSGVQLRVRGAVQRVGSLVGGSVSDVQRPRDRVRPAGLGKGGGRTAGVANIFVAGRKTPPAHRAPPARVGHPGRAEPQIHRPAVGDLKVGQIEAPVGRGRDRAKTVDPDRIANEALEGVMVRTVDIQDAADRVCSPIVIVGIEDARAEPGRQDGECIRGDV